MTPQSWCAVLLRVMPLAAGAQDWVLYADSEHGDKGFLDRSTLEVEGQCRTIWTMLERAEPVTFKGEPLKTWMAKVEVRCDERAHRSLHEAGLRPDGVMFHEARFEGPIRPSSRGRWGRPGSMRSAACARPRCGLLAEGQVQRVVTGRVANLRVVESREAEAVLGLQVGELHVELAAGDELAACHRGAHTVVPGLRNL